MPLKRFRATVANADTESLKSLHTLFDTYLDHILAKFNQILLSEMYKILSFLAKNRVFKTIFDKSFDAILEDVPVAETSV